MNVLSLFAGIGGLELGLERAGMTVVGQVELDPFCRSVLAKHWPEVPKHDDVRTCVDWWLGTERPPVDLVCGGFPCQPFSTAGRREGIADERWGWPWYWDVVRVLRPRWVLVENVAALLADRHAFGLILADLAAGGYDAEWDCIPAASVGAPHIRDRWFCVAYSDGRGRGSAGLAGVGRAMGERGDAARDASATKDSGSSSYVANTSSDGWRQGWPGGSAGNGSDRAGLAAEEQADADGERQLQPPRCFGEVGRRPSDGGWWAAEPDVGRVAYGIPARVDRLRALGNAVVPQVAEHIGRLIMTAQLQDRTGETS